MRSRPAFEVTSSRRLAKRAASREWHTCDERRPQLDLGGQRLEVAVHALGALDEALVQRGQHRGARVEGGVGEHGLHLDPQRAV